LRFSPRLNADLCGRLFAGQSQLRLGRFSYRGRSIDVRLHLPPTGASPSEAFVVDRVVLNGRAIGSEFVPAATLAPENRWEIFLRSAPASAALSLREVRDFSNPRNYFGPAQPQWRQGFGQDGVDHRDRHLVLRYDCPGESDIAFNIYRDGVVVARGVRDTEWIDPEPAGDAAALRHYAIEAIYPETGCASFLSLTRTYVPGGRQIEIPAEQMRDRGGRHFNGVLAELNAPTDEVSVDLELPRSARCALRVVYSNGSGPINTGITCAVKRIEVVDADRGVVLASGPLVMPHTAAWDRFLVSAPLLVQIPGGRRCTVRIYEGGDSRNMSYLEHNRNYTAFPGGGDSPVNRAHIAALHALQLDVD